MLTYEVKKGVLIELVDGKLSGTWTRSTISKATKQNLLIKNDSVVNGYFEDDVDKKPKVPSDVKPYPPVDLEEKEDGKDFNNTDIPGEKEEVVTEEGTDKMDGPEEAEITVPVSDKDKPSTPKEDGFIPEDISTPEVKEDGFIPEEKINKPMEKGRGMENPIFSGGPGAFSEERVLGMVRQSSKIKKEAITKKKVKRKIKRKTKKNK